MEFAPIAEAVGIVADGVGVVLIVAGTIVAFARFGLNLYRRSGVRLYHRLRTDIGRSILLGLEVLVAADIIRTVAIEPTFESLGILAGIVLIRTFLSFALEVELTGRWPWQRSQADN
ncbi:MAG: DUF1622 domain-containing protein [Chloroflexota bacterium]|nr:DUF1622 domain-containing protein [Chloroflexota bacterium]